MGDNAAACISLCHLGYTWLLSVHAQWHPLFPLLDWLICRGSGFVSLKKKERERERLRLHTLQDLGLALALFMKATYPAGTWLLWSHVSFEYHFCPSNLRIHTGKWKEGIRGHCDTACVICTVKLLSSMWESTQQGFYIHQYGRYLIISFDSSLWKWSYHLSSLILPALKQEQHRSYWSLIDGLSKRLISLN